MSEWISRDEKEPSMPDPVIRFDSVAYLVTDGESVGVSDFCRGHGCGKPWASWSMYGGIQPANITHWMPLPEPPK